MTFQAAYSVSLEDLPAMDNVLLSDIRSMKALNVHHLEIGFYLDGHARAYDVSPGESKARLKFCSSKTPILSVGCVLLFFSAERLRKNWLPTFQLLLHSYTNNSRLSFCLITSAQSTATN